jgi:hypothetical protein
LVTTRRLELPWTSISILFVPPERVAEDVLDLLSSVGFIPDDPDQVETTATVDGQFRGRIDGIRVDVFGPAIDYYASLALRCRTVMLHGKRIQILGPEDL